MRHCRSRRGAGAGEEPSTGKSHDQHGATYVAWQWQLDNATADNAGGGCKAGNLCAAVTLCAAFLICNFWVSANFLAVKVFGQLPLPHILTFLLIDASFCLGLLTAPTGKPIPTTAHNTSSTSVYISWKPPSPDTILGEFLGYRITYRPRDRSPNDTKEIYIRDNTVEVSCLLSACYNNWISLPHCLWHSSRYWERQQAPQIVLAIDFH